MGGVAVDAVGAARRDDLDRRRVRARIAHLHRARVRAQQQGLAIGVVAIDVERVLHGTGRVVFRAVERREVGPVILDFGAIGHVETDGAEDFLDTFPRAHHGMDAAGHAATAWQGHVDRFGVQTTLHLGIGQCITARCQRVLDLHFDGVDQGALRLARVRIQFAQALHHFSNLASLAQVAGFGVFKCGSVCGGDKVSLGRDDEFF